MSRRWPSLPIELPWQHIHRTERTPDESSRDEVPEVSPRQQAIQPAPRSRNCETSPTAGEGMPMSGRVATTIPPPEKRAVMTRIDDEKGCRNEQVLVRQGNLWFFPDMSMYVYYRPTHWRPCEVNERFSGFDGIEAKQ